MRKETVATKRDAIEHPRHRKREGNKDEGALRMQDVIEDMHMAHDSRYFFNKY